MGNYSNFFLSPITFAIVVATTFLTIGCTDVDDTLGYSLIPPDQEMKFSRHTMVSGIDSYIGLENTIPTNNVGYMRIGSTKSERFGSVTAGYASNFNYHTSMWFDMEAWLENEKLEDDDKNKKVITWEFTPYDSLKKGLIYGYQAKEMVEEVRLVLDLSKITGKNEVEQKFYIYELKENVGPEYTYDEKFPGGKSKNAIKKEIPAHFCYDNPEDVADLGAPLFSFTMQNEKVGTVEKVLTIEAAGAEYLQRIVGLEEETTPEKPSPADDEYKRGAGYDDDDYFHKHLKGICILPAQKGLDAAIYEVNLGSRSTYYSTPVTGIQIKTLRNREDEVYGENPDSIKVHYDLSDDSYYPFYPNVSISYIDHDYNGSDVNTSLFYNDEEGAQNIETDKIYVQGMLGVGGYLWFNDDFIAELKSLLTDENGKKWGVMSVNRAILRLWIDKNEVPLVTKSPTRLGMFYEMEAKAPFIFPYLASIDMLQGNTKKEENEEGKQVDVPLPFDDYMPIAIPDYPYQYESYSTFNYGGYKYRGEDKGYYEMNISALISSLVNYDPVTAKEGEDGETDEVKRGVWLMSALTVPISSGNSIDPQPQSAFELGEVVLVNDKEAVVGEGERGKRIEVELVYTLLKPEEGQTK